MSRNVFVLIISLLILAFFITTPKVVLFYDAPEYVDIVSKNGLIESAVKVHNPVRPVFMMIFWLVYRFLHNLLQIGSEYSGNLASFIFGLISLWLFYKLSIQILVKKQAYLATIVFSILPGVWIINTNLLNESITLTFFILSVLHLIKLAISNSKTLKLLFIISVALMLGTHVQSILWIPAIFSVPFLLNIKPSRDRQQIVSSAILILTALLLYFVFVSLFLGNTDPNKLSQNIGYLEFLANWLPSGWNDYISYLRYLRNIVLVMLRGYSNLAIILLCYLVLKKIRNLRFLFGVILLGVSIISTSWFWSGDFMIRRSIFAGVVFSLLLAKYYKRATYVLVAYLLLILIFNTQLYISSESEQMPFSLIKASQSRLPGSQVLVQTQYARPFTYDYDGEKIWVGYGGIDQIDNYLDEGKKIYFDSQALFSPYLLYVGNNLHITSLGKSGTSETKYLFEKYNFDLVDVSDVNKRIFIYELSKIGGSFEDRKQRNQKVLSNGQDLLIGKSQSGNAILLYSNKLSDKIHRERIDYGDILTWVWVLLTDRHEPIAWTYADKDGVYVYPINKKDKNSFYIKTVN